MQLDTRLPLMAGQRQPMQFAPESQLQTLSRIAPGINALRGVQQQEQQQAEMVRQRQAMQALQNQTRQILGRPDATIKDLADVFYAYGSTPEHFDAANKLTQAYLQEQTTRKEMAQFFPSIAGGEAPRNALAQPAAMPAGSEMPAGAAPDMPAAPSAEPSFGGVTQNQALRAAAMGTGRAAELGKMVLGKIPGAQGTPEDIRTLQALGMPPTLENLGRLAAAKRAPQELTPLQKAQLARATFMAEGKQNTPEFQENERLIAKLTSHPAGTNVEVKLPALESEERKAKGKFNVSTYEQVAQSARLAARTLPAIETQTGLLESGFRTGFGADAQKAAASVLSALGIPEATKYATDSQSFASALNQTVLQRQLEQKGPQTEADAQRISQTGAQLGNTVEANKFILDVARAQAKRDIEQRAFWDKWWRENKTYEGAEDAWYSGEGGKSLFDRPELRRYVRQPAANPPARTPQTGRPAGVGADWTLKQDANGNRAWVSPDGKRFVEVK